MNESGVWRQFSKYKIYGFEQFYLQLPHLSFFLQSREQTHLPGAFLFIPGDTNINNGLIMSHCDKIIAINCGSPISAIFPVTELVCVISAHLIDSTIKQYCIEFG